jgi:hypothetical protein
MTRAMTTAVLLLAASLAAAGEAPPKKDAPVPAEIADLWKQAQSEQQRDREAAFYALYQKISPGMSKAGVRKLFPPESLVEKPAPNGETLLLLSEDWRKKVGESVAFCVTISAEGFVKRKTLGAK